MKKKKRKNKNNNKKEKNEKNRRIKNIIKGRGLHHQTTSIKIMAPKNN